jgi:L-glyceraldehyde 3-phosphate reductase
MALAWILSRKQVTSVVIGASSLAQLEANAATIHNLDFTRDELAYIDNILV